MAANGRWNLFGGFDNDVKVGAGDVLPAADFDCGDLYDVVVEEVEACGFGVEKDYLFAVEYLDKVLEVGVVVVDEEVGGRNGKAAQLAHEIAGGGVFGQDVQMEEQAGPGDEASFVGDDIEMGAEELDGGGCEEVATRDFEMGSLPKLAAEAVGFGIGGDDDGYTAVGFHGGITFGEGDGHAVLACNGAGTKGAVGAVGRAAHLLFMGEGGEVVIAGAEKAAVGRGGLEGVVGGGQEGGVDA